MIKVHLSRLLGERRMTQKELAQKAGLRTQTVSKIYNEQVKGLEFDTIEKICRVLNCDLSDLLELRVEEGEKRNGQ